MATGNVFVESLTPRMAIEVVREEFPLVPYSIITTLGEFLIKHRLHIVRMPAEVPYNAPLTVVWVPPIT